MAVTSGEWFASSDNASLSSFPLLSTNAKQVFAAEEKTKQPEATVQYVQPGNFPQLRMQHHGAVSPQHSTQSNHHYHQQQQQQEEQHHYRQHQQPQHYQQPQEHEQHHVKHRQALHSTHAHNNEQQAQYYKQKNHQGQRDSPFRSQRPQNVDKYQQQHTDELQELEHHLHYLQEQHSQLEHEIQERKKQSPLRSSAGSGSAEYSDERPRSVRFASEIAQDIEEGREAPSDESTSRIHKDSPTSVAMFSDNSNEHDKSNTSVLAPKTLFLAPTSILRRKGPQALDSSGRYPIANRGRSHAPVFTDSAGREVSPIRSPGRQRVNTAYRRPMGTADDVGSIPDNPDARDVAVLFDPDTHSSSGILGKQVRD